MKEKKHICGARDVMLTSLGPFLLAGGGGPWLGKRCVFGVCGQGPAVVVMASSSS
jgi:hypothetical protein